jgi:hypothetical protein
VFESQEMFGEDDDSYRRPSAKILMRSAELAWAAMLTMPVTVVRPRGEVIWTTGVGIALERLAVARTTKPRFTKARRHLRTVYVVDMVSSDRAVTVTRRTSRREVNLAIFETAALMIGAYNDGSAVAFGPNRREPKCFRAITPASRTTYVCPPSPSLFPR